MADFPSANDLFRIARDEALARNRLLSLDVVERDGTDANVLLAGAAAIGDEVVSQVIRVERGQYLDSAKGAVLDRLVFDRYGLLRRPAAPAFGQVEFTTTASNPSPFSISSGTTLQADNGVQYVTTAAVTFPASTTGPITANVRSVLAGLDQQAKPGTIRSIVSSITGSPADLVVNNSLATAGADDAELDPSLIARARAFFTTARRGTIAAIEQGALAFPGVRTANAFEVLDQFGRPGRWVQLLITDAFTSSLASFSPVPGSYAVQSQNLANQVFSSLNDVRAAGIFVQVIVAEVIILPIVLNLTFAAGANIDEATAQAKAVAVNYTDGLASGETLDPDVLNNFLRTVAGLYPSGNEVASPAGPVVPLATQAIRTSLEIVTVGNC